jgi:hypothetical protein
MDIGASSTVPMINQIVGGNLTQCQIILPVAFSASRGKLTILQKDLGNIDMNLSSCFLVPKNSTKEAIIESLNETKKKRGFNSTPTQRTGY